MNMMQTKSYGSIALALGLVALLSLNVYLSNKVFRLEKRSVGTGYDVEDAAENDVEITDDRASDVQLAPAVSHNRIKRQTTITKRKERRRHWGCHLLGSPLTDQDFNNLGRDYILWKKPEGRQPAVCFLNLVPDVENSSVYRQIKIDKNGYYLVYVQMTFQGQGLTGSIGFKTVLIDGGEETVLLSTMVKQDRAPPNNTDVFQDSGYHSGYFNLKDGQRLEVRQFNSNVSTFLYRADTCYFGVVFMDKERNK